MTDKTAEDTTSTASTTKPTASGPSSDPTSRYIDYQVTVSAAAKGSELYTADKPKIEEKYTKLADAQSRLVDAKKEQQKTWDDLRAQRDRIKKSLDCDLSADDMKHLDDCWNQKVSEDKEATEPKGCGQMPACDQLSGKKIAELRDLEDLAESCVKWYDKEFDDLAELPEKLSDKLTELTTAATKLEDEQADSNSDPARIYVQYKDFLRKFDKVKRWFTESPAQFAYELKRQFVELLETHQKWICLQVAVHKWEEKQKLDEAEREKEGNLVDLVLECALKKQGQTETPKQSGVAETPKQSGEPETPKQSGEPETPKQSDEQQGERQSAQETC